MNPKINTLKEIIEKLDLKVISEGSDLNRAVEYGCCCDLLSWVMAHGKKDAVWITVQAHINVVAVASLLELAGVILDTGVTREEKAIEKARREEGITILSSELDAFELAGRLYEMGIGMKS